MKTLKMTVTKNDAEEDVFRLLTSEDAFCDVTVSSNKGTNDLKDMFAALLKVLMKDDVKVAFEKTEGYKPALYEDVCKDYIDILNGELVQARQEIITEGFAETKSDS